MFSFFFASPEEVLFDGQVLSVSVPGSYGYFEVLSKHAPLVSTLTSGKLTITDENKNKTTWIVEGGLFEVRNNQAMLLADRVNK